MYLPVPALTLFLHHKFNSEISSELFCRELNYAVDGRRILFNILLSALPPTPHPPPRTPGEPSTGTLLPEPHSLREDFAPPPN